MLYLLNLYFFLRIIGSPEISVLISMKLLQYLASVLKKIDER